MRKLWLSAAGIFVLLMSVATYFFVTQLKIEGGWLDEGEKSIVLTNKTWNITFSEKLDVKSVHEDSVYVTNDKGEKIATKIKLSDDLKTLSVEPPSDGYDLASKSYILHIGDEVQSVYGRGLNSEKKLKFVVQENLPLVGSRTELNDYFLRVMKEQKKSDGQLFKATMESAKEESNVAEDRSEGGGQDVSETNVQVQGVDESDIVKTNGTHIFQVVDGKINIIKVNDGKNMELESTITFSGSFSPSQLFLHEEKLVVIGYSYEEMKMAAISKDTVDTMIAPIDQTTKALVYDIENPSKPKEEREVLVEGNMISSRKIGANIYLVTNQFPQFWILEDNKKVDLRPRYSDSSVSNEILPVDYDKIQYFPDSKEPNYTMIASFNLEKPTESANIVTYLGSGQEMYMSKENLFLAVQNWNASPLEDGIDTFKTNLYKFAIKGLEVKFHSSTEVEGRILNQFSMDEHNGYFRIATTKGMTWDEEKPSSNNLFIFDENLKLVSSLEDLARGERIYSARFMGDRIYIVTFKETDPLFVIDASEPEKPKVMGELKIPGFSNYLHPYDENHLIGFGHDTKAVTSKDGSQPLILTNGVKISLFDISDMKNPKEKFTEIIGGRGTYSPLNYDHKALLFNKDKNLFAFPINVYKSVEGSEYEQSFEFQGAYVYNIDINEGFSLKSKISHMKGTTPYEEWENEIQRLLYIGDTLYAVSPKKISSYSMSDYKRVGELSM